VSGVSRPRHPWGPSLRFAPGANRPPGPLSVAWANFFSGKSLIIYGETRLGKTLWARSLGNHAYFGGLFSLDEPLDDVEYAVFDDLHGGLEFFHQYKSWLGRQNEFYSTDKYRAKKLISWRHRPVIYLSNNDPRYDKGVDIDWLNGNCVFVCVEQPIFRASTESTLSQS
jgi:hypothetical protein